MKKYLFLLSLLFSCSESNYCVSCIAQDPNGILIENEVVCNANSGFIDGFSESFEEGVSDRFPNDTTFVVICDKYNIINN